MATPLDALSGETGVFALLAVDHRGSFLPLLGVEDGDPEFLAAKKEIVSELGPLVSGVMIDPGSIAECVRSGCVPGSAVLIATVEADGYLAVSTGLPARVADGWSLEQARETGAGTIKILVQQPLADAQLARLDRAFVHEVHDRCRELGLAIVLEVLVPGGEERGIAEWTDGLVAAAAELSPYCDLYKTSFPALGDDAEVGAAACRDLTAAIAVPWVVLSGGVAPDVFERRLEVACREGASGFLAGRSVFGDALAGDPATRRRRLREQAVPRLERLVEITNRLARPWVPA
jgi:tagatose 1,6-diphosphate aldolase